MDEREQDADEAPHDILAAEEFGIGTRDDRLPPDPTGIPEPHDVLAAEEFAMPMGPDASGDQSSSLVEPRTLVPLAAIVLLLLVLLRRRAS